MGVLLCRNRSLLGRVGDGVGLWVCGGFSSKVVGKMIESPRLKAAGARWFHTSDYFSPNLSKASLGRFVYEVLKVGAEIGQIWPFNPSFDRSAVYFTVFMTESQKNELEVRFAGKIKFVDPPKVHLA